MITGGSDIRGGLLNHVSIYNFIFRGLISGFVTRL